MAITMLQGDSYPIFLNLKQDGNLLTPAMVADVEICVGEEIRYTLSGGTVYYDAEKAVWYFWPTQEETLGAEGAMDVFIRIKYPNLPAQLLGVKAGKIIFRGASFKEVL